ncbi:unnamed protein product [Lampetra fluviatilis]
MLARAFSQGGLQPDDLEEQVSALPRGRAPTDDSAHKMQTAEGRARSTGRGGVLGAVSANLLSLRSSQSLQHAERQNSSAKLVMRGDVKRASPSRRSPRGRFTDEICFTGETLEPDAVSPRGPSDTAEINQKPCRAHARSLQLMKAPLRGEGRRTTFWSLLAKSVAGRQIPYPLTRE